MKFGFLLSVFTLFFAVSLFAQTQNVVDERGLKQGKWVYDLSTDSLSGKHDLISLVNFVNDTLSGDFKVLKRESVVKEGFYLKGKKDGIERIYNERLILKEINFLLLFSPKIGK